MPIIGKVGGKLAPKAVKVIETVKVSDAAGMPAWFPKLVERVVKEGDDVTKKFGTVDMEIVHKTKLPESGTDVLVTQQLDTGDILVDVGLSKHGFSAGHLGQPIRLQLKKGEWIEPTKGKKGIKTKDEFSIEEAEFTGGHPENVKFEESTLNKYGEQGSDLSEVEQFATGKSGVSTGKSSGVLNQKGSKQLRKDLAETKKRQRTEYESGKAEADAERWAEDVDDFAIGGLARMLGE